MLRLIHLLERYIERASRPYADAFADKGHVTMPCGVSNVYGALVTLLEPILVAAREPIERIRALFHPRAECFATARSRFWRWTSKHPRTRTARRGHDRSVQRQILIVKKLGKSWTVSPISSDLLKDGGKVDGKAHVGTGPNSTAN
jgi:hypothetical protein